MFDPEDPVKQTQDKTEGRFARLLWGIVLYLISKLSFLFLALIGIVGAAWNVAKRREQNEILPMYKDFGQEIQAYRSEIVETQPFTRLHTVRILYSKPPSADDDILFKTVAYFVGNEGDLYISKYVMMTKEDFDRLQDDKTLLQLPGRPESAMPKFLVEKRAQASSSQWMFVALTLLHFVVGMHFVLRIDDVIPSVFASSLLFLLLILFTVLWGSEALDEMEHSYYRAKPKDILGWAYRVERALMPCDVSFLISKSKAKTDFMSYKRMDDDGKIVDPFVPSLNLFMLEQAFIKKIDG